MNPKAQLMMALRLYARSHVKAQLKEQIGIRAREVEAREITIAAEQYLTEHWRELLPMAEAFCARSNVRTNAQRKQRSNRSTIAVQKSGSKVEGQP